MSFVWRQTSCYAWVRFKTSSFIQSALAIDSTQIQTILNQIGIVDYLKDRPNVKKIRSEFFFLCTKFFDSIYKIHLLIQLMCEQLRYSKENIITYWHWTHLKRLTFANVNVYYEYKTTFIMTNFLNRLIRIQYVKP